MSFLGYGKTSLNSNVNTSLVNKDSSNYSGGFGSNEIPGQNGLPGMSGVKNNVSAAKMSGGSRCAIGGKKKCGCGSFKTLKNKIKNIIQVYKMKGRKTLKSIKNRLTKFKKGGKSKRTNKRRTNKRRISKRKMRGGYAQYQNNQPITPNYSLGGVLSANESALANPPPYKMGSTCVNCVDNYNHYTGKGVSSSGH